MQNCAVKFLLLWDEENGKRGMMCHWRLRKYIERIHRNLGHASADQLEKLFRDATVSDDAIFGFETFPVRCLRSFETASVKKISGSESCRNLQ